MRTIYALKLRKIIASPTTIICTEMLLLALLFYLPDVAFASVEGSLAAVQSKLVGTLLPLLAICGLIFAGISFVMGHANARQHLVFAVIGAAVGFGAESIVALIRSLIH